MAVRPLALSAAGSGRPVVSVDHYGDRDHRAAVENLSLLRDRGLTRYSPRALVELAGRAEAREVAYGSDLENHPVLVGRLARGRRLLGNPPPVLRAVRDPGRLASALRSEGLAAPAVIRSAGPDMGLRETNADPGGGARPDEDGRWLRKPLRGGGGRGVRPWRGEPLGPDIYLQERIDGLPFSVLFVADGASARVLGVAEMLVGRRAFGASGYVYCGALLRRDRSPPAGPAEGRRTSARRTTPEEHPVLSEARRIAEAVTRRFGLRGLNGADAVWSRDRLWTVEVNPRFTASMELLRGLLPIPLFELHREGSLGRLPDAGLRRAESRPGPEPDHSGRNAGRGEALRPRPEVLGKAVLRARRRSRVPALEELPGLRVADVPEVGEVIDAGRPVCTVFGSGRSRDACLRSLQVAAERVNASLEPAETAAGGGGEPGGRPRVGHAGAHAQHTGLRVDRDGDGDPAAGGAA